MAGTRKETGPSSERVAAALRRIRQDRGLSYAELARRLASAGHPILDTGLMKIEKGQRRVDVDDLMALAVALGTTPNRLLLPEVEYADPGAATELTEGVRARIGDSWAWAYGEKPLGVKPASFADEGSDLPRGELRFIGENRRHYARGGFGWLGEVGDWLGEGAPGPGKARRAGGKAEASGLIAAAILSAFTRHGLDTRDIRQAAESGIMATLVQEEPGLTERGEREVWAWLMTQDGTEGDGDEEGEG